MNGLPKHIPPALLIVVAGSFATPIAAEVIWRGDFETGTTEQWRGTPKGESVKVVQDRIRFSIWGRWPGSGSDLQGSSRR